MENQAQRAWADLRKLTSLTSLTSVGLGPGEGFCCVGQRTWVKWGSGPFALVLAEDCESLSYPGQAAVSQADVKAKVKLKKG